VVDGHAGLGLRSTDAIELGVVGRNLIPGTDAWDRPPEVRGGARVIGKNVGWLEFDGGWRQGDASPLLSAGGEIGPDKARLRAGWRLERSVQSVSAGIGYSDTGGSIEYGIEVPLGSTFSPRAILPEISVRFSAPPSITAD